MVIFLALLTWPAVRWLVRGGGCAGGDVAAVAPPHRSRRPRKPTRSIALALLSGARAGNGRTAR